MLCDICQKREAKIYYTEIIKGEKKEQRLCEVCAAEKTSFQINKDGGNLEGAISGFLSNILGNIYGESKPGEPETTICCPVCKSTYEEVLRGGKFGCAACYDVFREMVDKSLKQIQGSNVHVGKHPKQKEATDKKEKNAVAISETDRLSILLQEAIEREAFEEAAELRDKLRALKGGEECLNGTKNREN